MTTLTHKLQAPFTADRRAAVEYTNTAILGLREHGVRSGTWQPEDANLQINLYTDGVNYTCWIFDLAMYSCETLHQAQAGGDPCGCVLGHSTGGRKNPHAAINAALKELRQRDPAWRQRFR